MRCYRNLLQGSAITACHALTTNPSGALPLLYLNEISQPLPRTTLPHEAGATREAGKDLCGDIWNTEKNQQVCDSLQNAEGVGIERDL